MELSLDPGDLLPKHQYPSPTGQVVMSRDVTYCKLTPQARAAVLAVGFGTFYSWDKSSYKRVYLPDNVLDVLAAVIDQTDL